MEGSPIPIERYLGFSGPLDPDPDKEGSGSRRCLHCEKGYLAPDVYGDLVCTACARMPVMSSYQLRKHEPTSWLRDYTKTDGRQQVPGDSPHKNPGNPAIESVFVRVLFRPAPISARFVKVMKITYIRETEKRTTRFIAMSLECHNSEYDWMCHLPKQLTEWIGQAFKAKTGETLFYLKDWLVDEKKKWKKRQSL